MATSVRPPLLPLRRIEGFLVADIAQKGQPSLLHQALVTLGVE
jgi:hypothetical protein